MNEIQGDGVIWWWTSIVNLMNMDSPVSRHHPLGHNWCPANPSWDQLLSKKGKQIYFLLFQEINIAVVECWFMFQPNIYFRISDLQIQINYLTCRYMFQTHRSHVQSSSGPGSPLQKRKKYLLSFRKKTSFSSTIFFFFLFTIRVWRYFLDDEKLQPSKKVKPSDFSLVKIGSWEMLEKCFVEWEQ